MGKNVEIEQVTMRFGDFVAVRNANLSIEAGEFFSFLGPSGCGKTTLLRLISGFIEPSEGVIRIGGADMRGIPPNRRPTALIFQNLALFPLMTVWENIAFGLEARGVDRNARKRRAQELLELIALPDQGDKKVSELSGGQRQRVAIARALAVEPAVLLLDEPLSALDLKLRQHMRAELRALQRKTGVTFIYITHDQGEALTMSDRVAVMSQGVVEQIGTPTAIYNDPVSAGVARFVGETNVFDAQVTTLHDDHAGVTTRFGTLHCRNPWQVAAGAQAQVFVRPERCRLGTPGEARNQVPAQVLRLDFEGAFANVMLEAEGHPLMVQMPNHGEARLPAPGDTATVVFEADDALLLGDTARQ